ncbi:MAG: hypothetical protein ACFFDI_32165 [Promethearchaeota archaeon]
MGNNFVNLDLRFLPLNQKFIPRPELQQSLDSFLQELSDVVMD